MGSQSLFGTKYAVAWRSNMAKIDIVMTSYNGETYIKEQIESILRSECQDFTLSIYDDGSTDETMDIIKEYEREYPDKIKAVKNKVNLGVTLNFLEGIKNTKAKYIMLCDQDDVWKANKIGNTLEKMQELEEENKKDTIPLAVFTDGEVVGQDLELMNPSFFDASHLDPEKTQLSRLLMENKLIGCTVMINATIREVLSNNPLPKYARFHDGWIALIASTMGEIGYLDESTLLYRQHENNVVGNIGFLSYTKDRVTSLSKQRSALIKSQLQAREFYELYKDYISKKDGKTILRFAYLHRDNLVKRKYKVVRYNYLKTGLVRNIGLIIII